MTPTLQNLTAPAQPTPDDGSQHLLSDDPSFDPLTNPAIKAVVDQKVPGILLTPAELKLPDVMAIAKNSAALPKLGLGIYSNPGKGVALFNPSVVTLEEIQKVAKAGKLDKLLAPYSQFANSAAGGDSGPPPTQITNPVQGVPPPQPATPVQPLSRGAQTANAKAQLAPTKQKAPGGGLLLNSLLKS